MSPLEEYRREALAALRANLRSIQLVAEDVLGRAVVRVAPIGSILDRNRFHEASDVDVGIEVQGHQNEREGVSEKLSRKVQEEMLKHPIHPIGVVNTVVFVVRP